MTNQQGTEVTPNNQGHIRLWSKLTRYKIGYATDEWGMRSSSPSGIPDPAGACVRYEDHIAALVEAQQPATHVQDQAEIEHVAGDVSKTGPESNMAQQPAPSAAAAGQRRSDLVPGVMHCARCKFQLNRVTLCVSDGNAYAGNNETEPCPNGCGPLWPVTWEQEARNCWKALEEMHERLHPAPTPQADSQPAPVADGCTDPYNCKRCMTHPSHRDGMEHAGIPTHAVARAARAPADSVTAPAGGANWQDISTAPKDGTQFVAVGNDYGLYSEPQHTCIAQWFRGCWMEVSEWNEDSELKYLTHWMPLPPLPGSADRKKGGA